MNFNSLIASISDDNSNVIIENTTRILQEWNKISDKVMNDIQVEATRQRSLGHLTSTISLHYMKGTDVYDHLFNIYRYQNATPDAYFLPLNIATENYLSGVNQDLDEKNISQGIVVSLDTTKTYPEESNDLVDPKGVLVEFEGNNIKFEAH